MAQTTIGTIVNAVKDRVSTWELHQWASLLLICRAAQPMARTIVPVIFKALFEHYGGTQRASRIAYDAVGLWANCNDKQLAYYHCLDDEQWVRL